MVARAGAVVGTSETALIRPIRPRPALSADQRRDDRHRHRHERAERQQQDDDRGRQPDHLGRAARRAARASGRRRRRPRRRARSTAAGVATSSSACASSIERSLGLCLQRQLDVRRRAVLRELPGAGAVERADGAARRRLRPWRTPWRRSRSRPCRARSRPSWPPAPRRPPARCRWRCSGNLSSSRSVVAWLPVPGSVRLSLRLSPVLRSSAVTAPTRTTQSTTTTHAYRTQALPSAYRARVMRRQSSHAARGRQRGARYVRASGRGR